VDWFVEVMVDLVRFVSAETWLLFIF